MALGKTVVMLLAGGKGSRLNILAHGRAKPAVPFGGIYRIVDFTLSNAMHSGLTRVGLLTQYRPTSLIEHVGMEPRELAQAIEKLFLWSGKGSTITVDKVESVVAQPRLHTVFELVDSIIRKDLTGSLVLLRCLLEQREPAIKLLALILRQFRLTWQFKALTEEGVSSQEMPSRLHLPGFAVRKLQAPARRITHSGLMGIYDHILAADLRIKSTGREEEAILVELVTRLCLLR